MIRKATENDLRHLTRLSEIYYKEHWSSGYTTFDYEYCFEQIKNCVISPLANVIVAELNGTIIGFSVGFLSPLQVAPVTRCIVAYNYIDPAHRSSGLFSDMISVQTDWAMDHKCVDINISDGGQYNGKFGTVLKGLGFERTGTEGYKVLAQ